MVTGRRASFLLGGLVLVGAMLLVPSPATAEPSQVDAGAAAAAGSAARTPQPLADSSRELVQGTRNSQGGCDFTPPDVLTLAPGQRAIEIDQVSIDLAACTTVYEVGVPAVGPATAGQPTDMSTLTASSVPTSHGPAGPVPGRRAPSPPGSVQPLSYSGSGSGYEKAWQTDIINLTVNSVQSNLSWSWNAGCTQSGAGSVNYYWRSGSGWEPPYNNGSWIYRNCSYAQVWSQADYKNTGFCWPNTVYSHYRDIQVAGWFDGGFAGSVGTVSHSGNGGCAPLYDHWKLVRVT